MEMEQANSPTDELARTFFWIVMATAAAFVGAVLILIR
jgi:hypothetical protein